MDLSKDIFRKIKPVTISELCDLPCWLMGSGGYAAQAVHDWRIRPFGLVVDTENNFVKNSALENLKELRIPEIEGDIFLASSFFQDRLKQLERLSKYNLSKIDRIFILDPDREHRVERHCVGVKNTKKLLISKLGSTFRTYESHLRSVKRYFKNNGYDIATVCPLFMYSYPDFFDADDVLLWGGIKSPFKVLDHIGLEGSRTYFEYGFFPQSKFFYFDRSGVNERCELMNSELDWITERHLDKLNIIRRDFLSGFKKNRNSYILVPLQVPTDTNVVVSTRFKNGMQEFIDFICSYYPADERIVFKAHPKDRFKGNYNYRGRAYSELPFLKLLENAKLVHGMTSSTLYEAALANVPVISEGKSLINKHKGRLEALLAAMVDRQVHVDSDNLDYHIGRYSNFKVKRGI